MKCKVYYKIDGVAGLFVVEDRDTEKCRQMMNSEIERLGLSDEKNNVKIDVEFENQRSAWFLGIPLWYWVDRDDFRGRNFFYDILFIAALGFTELLSWGYKFFTGRVIEFCFKVKEIE